MDESANRRPPAKELENRRAGGIDRSEAEDGRTERGGTGSAPGGPGSDAQSVAAPEAGILAAAGKPDDPFGLFSGENMTGKHWRILEAAIRVFSEKGFSAARTSEIAKEAGVSEGTLFNYFKTKRDLLTGLLLPLFARYFRPLVARSIEEIIEHRGQRALDQVLFEIMRDRIHLIQKNWPLVKTVAAEAAFHPELLDPIRRRVAPYMLGIGRRWVQEEKVRGTVRDVDENTAIRIFMSMIVGYVLSRQVFPDLFPWEEEEVEIARMMDLYLHGILRGEPGQPGPARPGGDRGSAGSERERTDHADSPGAGAGPVGSDERGPNADTDRPSTGGRPADDGERGLAAGGRGEGGGRGDFGAEERGAAVGGGNADAGEPEPGDGRRRHPGRVKTAVRRADSGRRVPSTRFLPGK